MFFLLMIGYKGNERTWARKSDHPQGVFSLSSLVFSPFSQFRPSDESQGTVTGNDGRETDGEASGTVVFKKK